LLELLSHLGKISFKIGSLIRSVKHHFKIDLRRHLLVQIKHLFLLFGLFIMSLYILGSRSRYTGTLAINLKNLTDAEIPVVTTIDKKYAELEEKMDTLFLLLQTQLNPLVDNLKIQKLELERLEEMISIQPKSETSPSLLQALVSLNEELDSKIKRISIDLDTLANESANQIIQIGDTIEDKFNIFFDQAVKKVFEDLLLEDSVVFRTEKSRFVSGLEQKVLQQILLMQRKPDSISIYEKYGPDYSLWSAGATIMMTNTSPSYLPEKDQIIKGLNNLGGPQEVLIPAMEPGRCWGMKGNCW
jgi:predicted transcriptional regulator